MNISSNLSLREKIEAIIKELKRLRAAIANSSGGSGDTPTLQQVINTGNVITDGEETNTTQFYIGDPEGPINTRFRDSGVVVTNGANSSNLGPGVLSMYNDNGNSGVYNGEGMAVGDNINGAELKNNMLKLMVNSFAITVEADGDLADNFTHTHIAAGGIIPIVRDIAPASATATGTKGEIRITATYIYTCIATDTWVRSVAATW